jgi:hypothetical protein
MPRKRASQKVKSEYVFGHAWKGPKMLRAGLYARVSTNDQQTLAMQNRAMLDDHLAGPRDQIRAAKRKARQRVLGAARRREK